MLLEKRTSKLNGEIKVTKSFGRVSVWVGGFQQSGPLVAKAWQKGISKVAKAERILVLGLGCGSIAPLLIKKFPDAKITGLEIDPIIIEIGKKYFGLDKYKNLKIVNSDANKFTMKEQFDLVIIDMYKGGESRINRDFSKLLKKGGTGIINRLENLKNKMEFFYA